LGFVRILNRIEQEKEKKNATIDCCEQIIANKLTLIQETIFEKKKTQLLKKKTKQKKKMSDGVAIATLVVSSVILATIWYVLFLAWSDRKHILSCVRQISGLVNY